MIFRVILNSINCSIISILIFIAIPGRIEIRFEKEFYYFQDFKQDLKVKMKWETERDREY
jgi:accessory gene regulator protein AgrB